MIDEVRIWDHARTPTEILEDYDAQVASAPGMVHRWSLNEGYRNDGGGLRGNAANGTIHNATWETVNLVVYEVGVCDVPAARLR